jgi:nicotinate-nucleotide pyrophosphorylase (carboxylating)
LRAFEKHAVLCGGGKNHRMGLYDAVLIKDNHIRLCGSPSEAVRRARARARGKAIEVEVDTLAQLRDALEAGPDIVLLDNMDFATMKRAVAIVAKKRARVLTEISGGVRLESVRRIARLGVDRISVGALTHSAPAVDLSLEFF